MTKSPSCRLYPRLLVVVLASMRLWQAPARGQAATWQALPFPLTSDWPGPFGRSAVISSNSILLQGQPARTAESFAAPFTIRCDVQLASRFTDDGAFVLYLLEPGQPANTDPTAGLAVQLIYSNTGDFGSVDRLQISRLGGPALWSNPSFHLAGGTTYHLTLGVSAAGRLDLSVEGTSYPIPSDVIYPYPRAQIQLGGWQPNDTWTVSDFTLVPEPPAEALLGAGLLGWAASIHRRRGCDQGTWNRSARPRRLWGLPN